MANGAGDLKFLLDDELLLDGLVEELRVDELELPFDGNDTEKKWGRSGELPDALRVLEVSVEMHELLTPLSPDEASNGPLVIEVAANGFEPSYRGQCRKCS